MATRLSIAQVTPYPWEDDHEVNGFVRSLSAELAERGHAVTVLAPSRAPGAMRETRRALRAGELDERHDGVRVLPVGELLPTRPGRRGAVPAPPVDIARTIEELLTQLDFDIVHVHEPFAPSAASVALRHSRALNVGTFHAPAERVMSTQVARRFVELFFGRLDARAASFRSTAELMRRVFPGHYEVVRPGAAPSERTAHDGPLRIVFVEREERAALRLFLRALRRLPQEPAWEAEVFVPTGAAPASAEGSRLKGRVTITDARKTSERDVLARADVLVAASTGVAASPGLVAAALGAGAIPVAARLPAYEELLEDGAGLMFEPGDVDVLAEQLARVIADEDLRTRLRAAGGADNASWSHVADAYEATYERLVARRHRPVPPLTGERPLIEVDLHMHTDHSYDCATPVDDLLAAARKSGLGAIAVTDHNEVSGAHEAAKRAHNFGVKVIIGEEVKTATQGEVIGLFIEEKIPKGLSLAETIGEIKRQGGLVYVPHPFDRLHSVPDYEHLLDHVEDIDIIEVFNPRIAIPAFNEEAQRFAAKYRIVGGAGSDSHVAQGLGSVRIRMRDFDGPDEFLRSLAEADIVGRPSALYYAGVQALKFLQTKAPSKRVRRAARNL